VRPSWIWTLRGAGLSRPDPWLVNDGVAGVPGVLRVSVLDTNGNLVIGGCLDGRISLAGKGFVRPQFPLPKETAWKGLRLKAEIEVKGQRHPVRWSVQARRLNATAR